MNNTLSTFYERDLRNLIEEIRLFKDDQNLWRTIGSIKNPAGNLALHIIGGTHYLIGVKLANTNYIRKRDEEFTRRGVPKGELIAGVEALIPLVKGVLRDIDLSASYPIPFDDAERTNGYVLTQLLAHLNYHLGQVNYLRRALEGGYGGGAAAGGITSH